MDADERPEPLSFGLVCDSSAESRPWFNAVTKEMRRVAKERSALRSPLNLNVVFHVPGPNNPVDFIGVRTGSYFKEDNVLMVQVAVETAPPPNPAKAVYELAAAAIDAAEGWARSKGIADDLSSLKSFTERLRAETS